MRPKCQGEMRIIAFIVDHDVVDANLRPLAMAEAPSPRSPQSAAIPSVASLASCRQQSLLWGVPVEATVRPAKGPEIERKELPIPKAVIGES